MRRTNEPVMDSTTFTSATGYTFQARALKAGARFDTEAESGCVVVAGPHEVPSYEPHGTFYALDSEGVECQYSTIMVKWIHA